MEEYIGVKFNFLDDGARIEENQIKKFLKIEGELGRFLKTRKNEGNLSMRSGAGFLIKRAGARMTKLRKSDVVFVRKIVGGMVFCSGGTPSSESLMHYNIYKKVRSAYIILHYHYDKLLNRLKVKKVGPFQYGSLALARNVGKTARKNKIIEITRHGFVITAKNQKELYAYLTEIINGEYE